MTITTTPAPGEIFTGSRYVSLCQPDPTSFDLAEIFGALSRLSRFTGHGRFFYSVAEHTLTCLAICDARREPREIRRAVLMHDASEAYLGDVSTPLKSLLPDYRHLERKMQAAIFDRFQISDLYQVRVRAIDLAALTLEKAALMPEAGTWPTDVNTTGLDGCLCSGWLQHTAEAELLRHAEALGVV